MSVTRLLSLVALVCLLGTAWGQSRQSVLIRSPKPYDKLVQTIEAMGGTVTMQFKYVDGIAADVPGSALSRLEKLVGADNLAKDEIIDIPENAATQQRAQSFADEVEIAGEASPADYAIENVTSNATALHSAGFTGSGMIIAIIDSGFRPGPTATTFFPHIPMSRVIQPGFSLVPGEPNAISHLNYPHGTQVASMAAANVVFCFGNTTRLAVVARDLGAAQTGTGPAPGGNGCSTTQIRVPIAGSAPLARIYPVKIFPNSGAGSPNSRTIAAMQHVLDQRLAYNADPATGQNIKVVNMSLGGPTSKAGRTLSDEMVQQLLVNDIVPVISSGNDGFASITNGSPGTSMAALTVGAASNATQERIYTGQFRSPCGLASTPLAQVTACANTYRPDNNTQVVDFSSRGPTHDGRIKPEVIASGAYAIAQGSGTTSTGTVNFIFGTSFSSPEVAGIATILRQAVPTATARQVRNAIIMSANPALVPSASSIDQGNGYVNAAAALALLQNGDAPDTVELGYKYNRNLQANLAQAGRTVYSGGVTLTPTGVKPAATAEIAYQVPKNAGSLNVRVRDVIPANPLAQQNQFFGDDVYIQIQGSTVHDADYRTLRYSTATPPAPLSYDFVKEGQDKTYTFANPESGIWRIVPTGDWTNAGDVSFTVDVWTTEDASPQSTAKAKIGQGEQHAYTLAVPAGTAALKVNFAWLSMNDSYPINDLDVYLVAPDGVTVVLTCATGLAPEACAVPTPAAGNWTVVVDGFRVYPGSTPMDKETYTLRVEADGKVLKP